MIRSFSGASKNDKRDKHLYYRITNSFDQICKKIFIKKNQKLDFQNIKSCFSFNKFLFSRENILSAYGVDSKFVHLGDTFHINKSFSAPKNISQVLSLGSINALKVMNF